MFKFFDPIILSVSPNMMLAYFSHLAPLVLYFFFTKMQSQKRGARHNAKKYGGVLPSLYISKPFIFPQSEDNE